MENTCARYCLAQQIRILSVIAATYRFVQDNFFARVGSMSRLSTAFFYFLPLLGTGVACTAQGDDITSFIGGGTGGSVSETGTSSSTDFASTGDLQTSVANGSDSGDESGSTSIATANEDSSSTTQDPEMTSSSTTEDTGQECIPKTLDCPCVEGECYGELICENEVCVESEQPEMCVDDDYGMNDSFDKLYPIPPPEGQDVFYEKQSGSVVGVLHNLEDVDWFAYDVGDGFWNANPEVKISEGLGEIRVCQYFTCANQLPPVTVTCDDPSSSHVIVDLSLEGCCSEKSFTMDRNCSGTNDSGTFYLMVESKVDMCISYRVDFFY